MARRSAMAKGPAHSQRRQVDAPSGHGALPYGQAAHHQLPCQTVSSRLFSEHERRQADRFYADLMGLSRSRGSSSAEKADESPDLRNGRVVFYDEDTLRCMEGWTRADGRDRVFLIN